VSAFTELDIWNLALTRIGADAIEDRKEKGKAADLCRLHYAPTRDALLRKHAWNFATERKKLGLVRTASGEKRSKGFKLPADCLKVVRGFDGATDAEIDFRVEGREVKTDAATIKIEYIAKVQKEGLFDDAFVEALAWSLAATLAMGLSRDPKIAELCAAKAQQATAEAIAVDLAEGTPRWLADAKNEVVLQAITRMGRERVQSLEEGWRCVSLANRLYDRALDAVLRAHPWNFATKRVSLSSPYTLPADFVMAVAAFSGTAEVTFRVTRTTIENPSASTFTLEYVANDTGSGDALFRDAVVWKLCSELATMFSDGKPTAGDCLAAYASVLAQAVQSDLLEGSPRWLSHAASPVVIAALQKVGRDKITSVQRGWQVVFMANRLLPDVVKQVLRQHRWNFRTFREEVETSAAEGDWSDDWPYKAAMPAGWVRLVEVRSANGDALDYVLANGVLRLREEDPVVEYLGAADTAGDGTGDALFLDAVAWKLAAELASRWSEVQPFAGAYLREYERALSEARLADAQENPALPPPLSSWERARL
jgi:hypothetical protein